MTEKAILFDTTKCIACRACQVACKQWWELPGVTTTNRGTLENPPDLSAQTWNKIRFNEVGANGTPRWVFTRQSCMHCTEAVCVWVCPTYARSYDELGYVTIDPERCIGCARCVAYCPFGVPRIGPGNVSSRIPVQSGTTRFVAYKCKFCGDRVANGLTPACVKTCPPGALQFGERAEMVEQGRTRVDTIKTTYPQAHLYGENELGGLHVMYILTDAPPVHGLPESPQFGTYAVFDQGGLPEWYKEALANGTMAAFPGSADPGWYLQPPAGTKASWTAPVQWSALGLGVVGAGAALWWTIRRRMTPRKDNQKSA